MQHKLLILLICSWLGAVQAAELGDAAPRSFIGQPLAVDIDLLALSPEELAGLQVRLADANVYRGANVAMNPALASVRLQVERRGQKPVLHVTTTRPVDAEYVHLFVQLGVPGKQDVRLATVWLQQDPNPAPPPAPVAPAVPLASAMTAAQAEQVAAQARATRAAAAKEAAGKEATSKEATSKEAASKEAASKEAAGQAAEAAKQAAAATAAASARDRSKPAPLPSMHEAETGVQGEVKAAAAARRIAGVWVSADGKLAKAPTSEETAQVPVNVAQALLPLAPLPLPKGVKRPAASCAPTGMSAKECVALDGHNAELSTKLIELEGKMKALQGALGSAPAAKPAPGVADHVAPSASAGATASGSALATASGAASSASARLSARAEPEMHAAKAPAAEAALAASGGASAASISASAASASQASASAPAPVATKQVRVLPKLKYKKEKLPEPQTDYTLPLAAGGVGLLALLGAGFIWWRKKKSGNGPLKIWQGFRKKKAADPLPEEFAEVETATQ